MGWSLFLIFILCWSFAFPHSGGEGKEISGLLIDWLELLDPEIDSLCTDLQDRLLFGKTSDVSSSKPSVDSASYLNAISICVLVLYFTSDPVGVVQVVVPYCHYADHVSEFDPTWDPQSSPLCSTFWIQHPFVLSDWFMSNRFKVDWKKHMVTGYLLINIHSMRKKEPNGKSNLPIASYPVS